MAPTGAVGRLQWPMQRVSAHHRRSAEPHRAAGQAISASRSALGRVALFGAHAPTRLTASTFNVWRITRSSASTMSFSARGPRSTPTSSHPGSG